MDLEKKYAKLEKSTEEEVIAATIKRVAEPTVAGHPTGGAVDAIIYDKRKLWTYSPEINPEHLKNRLLLRKIMQNAGFAPYDAEWWHFSYGDKTWAAHYSKSECLYTQKALEEIKLGESK